MAADTEPIEILLHLPLLAEDKVRAADGRRRQAAAAARLWCCLPLLFVAACHIPSHKQNAVWATR